MGKKPFHFFTIIALCLFLPLSGMSATKSSCPCSGELINGQESVNTNKIDQHSECGEEKQLPQPYSSCPYDSGSCGMILENKKITPDPFLTESTGFVEAMDLKTAMVAFINLDQAFLFDPDPFPNQVLYLQIHSLRC